MSRKSDKRKREIQRAEAERVRRKKDLEEEQAATEDEEELEEEVVLAPAPRRPFRGGHAVLALALLVFAAGHYWLGREMQARYRLNVVRYPELVSKKRQVDPDHYDFHLRKAAALFPYDGVLQLELARILYEQGDISLYADALKHNDLAFKTHFDVKAYKQRAWIHRWLYQIELNRRNREAAARHFKNAIDGFELVLLLNPGDVETLERLAWIYSRAALDKANTEMRAEKWERAIEYAKRLLDEEHDNTNALYFLGVGYDNMSKVGAKDRAAYFYLRTLEMDPLSTMKRKRLWDRAAILDYLKTQRKIPETIPDDLKEK